MSTTNSQGQRAFFEAIKNGQVNTVKKMVAEKPELLNAFDDQSYGATPITSLCFGGDRKMLSTMIELGADLNRRSDWDMGPWSPMHCAVMACDHDLANFLLEKGASLDAHGASGLGKQRELERLLDESPQRVSEPGGDGCHPLHFADTPEIAQLLLSYGADINARCLDHHSTPVQYLADHRKDVARYLFAQGATADIFSAVMANDAEVVSQLVTENPRVLDARINQSYFPPGNLHNVHNIMTFTIGSNCAPMHAAAKGNHPKMIRLLSTLGQSVSIRGGYDDATPLHLAAWEDNVEAALELVDREANINIRSGSIHNNSPAGWAIVAGSANVFEILMERNAEILEHFARDAQAAVEGKFLQYKTVSQNNYERIQECLAAKIGD